MNGPHIFKRNADKLFLNNEKRTPKRTKTKKSTLEDDKGLMIVSDIISLYNESCSSPKCDAQIVLLQALLENVREELKEMKLKEHYQREMYSVMPLRDEVICMETGLPNKQIFLIVVNYVRRFSAEINYSVGFMLRQNYTNLHLAELFHCSTATISNIILTFVRILYKLLYEDCLQTVPSREKNRTSFTVWALQNGHRLHRY